MDRSFLSHAGVVAASRAFVCIRLATYENAEEMRLLKSLFVGKSGEVENTVICMLTPDGKQSLVRAHRGPKHLFAGADDMAKAMQRISAEYPARRSLKDATLPKVANLRLAINVAACDNRPLAVVCAASPETRGRLEKSLAQVAWSDTFVGRFEYAVLEDMKSVLSRDVEGIVVLQSDRYGLKTQTLAECAAHAGVADIEKTLRTGAGRHQAPDKTFPSHIRQGHMAGVFWETATPVTDPMERMAREKGKRK